jgi:small subunit ribosomal protein S12e
LAWYSLYGIRITIFQSVAFIFSEEGAVPQNETPAVADAPAPLGEPMDLMTALQLVLRKSLAHGGLSRGLHEGAKMIEKHTAQLCVLAEDCNQPDYVKLVKALCADHKVNLLSVPSAKTLGEWAGVSISSASCF